VWEPPHRLVYLWHLRFDRADATEVGFAPAGSGTAVSIVHRGWERLGAKGPGAARAQPRGLGGSDPALPPRLRLVAGKGPLAPRCP
jgi:Activator of Hsp90 ATPase homolog 1-like protein